jgi:UDP-N-acetylmuramate dehydrogenase
VHANFIINSEDASAADIWNLMQHVREVVHQKCGILLEPEIETLGEFPGKEKTASAV